MQGNVNTDAEERAREYLRWLVREYTVFIDTCSWMEQEIELFARHLIDALDGTDKAVYLALSVYNELVKLSQDNENTERCEKASRAIFVIRSLKAHGKLILIGEPGDTFADNILYSKFSEFRLTMKMALVTQDKELSREILGLNEIQSSRGLPIVVCRINQYGYLSVFNPNNGLNDNSTQTPLSAPKFRLATRLPTIPNQVIRVLYVPKENDIVLINGVQHRLDKRLGGGDESDVFISSTLPGKAIKIYNDRNRDEYRRQKLQLMISQKIRYPGICWPESIAFNSSNEFVGFVMPEVSGAHEVDDSICCSRDEFEECFPNWKRIDLVQLCITILEKIEYLHRNNIILGDINSCNILVKSPNEVYFVDCDSYQIEEYPCPKGTIIYTPPELQGKPFETVLRSFGNEYFSIATLLFMLMLPGKAPYAQQGGGSPEENIRKMNFSYACGELKNGLQPQGPWRLMWSHLPKKVKEMFYSTFRKGEANSTEATRFTTSQWLNQFREYKKLLAPDGYLLKNDEMSNWIYPTRLKDHDVTCKNCKIVFRYKDGMHGYCPSCEPKFWQKCKGCGEGFFTNQLRFGYCNDCNNEVVKRIVCQNPTCGKTFNFTRGEQLYYRSKGFPEPIRCPECRANKRGSVRSQNMNVQKTSHTASVTPRAYTPARPAYTPTNYSNTAKVQNTTPNNTITTQTKKKGCFITTAVCEYFGKPDDCWELTLLRHFRDHYMKSTVAGRILVEQYYDIAPKVVKILNESDQKDLIYSMLWKHYIRPCLQLIVDEKPEECQRLYQDMVEMLLKNLNGLQMSIASSDVLENTIEEETSQQSNLDEDCEFDVLQQDTFDADVENVSKEQCDNSESSGLSDFFETDEVEDDPDEHLAELESDIGEEDSGEQFANQDEGEATVTADRKMDSLGEDDSADAEGELENSDNDDEALLPMLPVVFCVDISRNIDDEAIEQINCGLHDCIEALSHSNVFNAEICIVTFDSRAEVLCPFSSADRIDVPRIVSQGRSMHLSKGINLSLDLLEERTEEYRQKDVYSSLPRLILVTSGYTIGEAIHDRNVAIDRVNELIDSGSMDIIPLCVGALDEESALHSLNTQLYHLESFEEMMKTHYWF